jgi:hypothetical protein
LVEEDVPERNAQVFDEAVLVQMDGASHYGVAVAGGDQHAVEGRPGPALEAGAAVRRRAFPADGTFLVFLEGDDRLARLTEEMSGPLARKAFHGKEEVEKKILGRGDDTESVHVPMVPREGSNLHKKTGDPSKYLSQISIFCCNPMLSAAKNGYFLRLSPDSPQKSPSFSLESIGFRDEREI